MIDKNTEQTSPFSPLKPENGRSVAVAIQGGKTEAGGFDSSPKVIASGRGKLAEEILQIAFARGVRVREDADLAELLVKLDLDTPIPSEAIIVVAEILAKVYEANGRLAEPSLSSSGDEI
jgi:flagellar biosynthesis protein